jgi:hypothetical protein
MRQPTDPLELIRLVQASRAAAGLTVRYRSPYTDEDRECTRANEADKADFCRRVVAAGGTILK